MRGIIILIAALIAVSGGEALAQDETKQSTTQGQSGGDLRSAVQNPISSLISLPFKFTFDYGAPNGEASFLNRRGGGYAGNTQSDSRKWRHRSW